MGFDGSGNWIPVLPDGPAVTKTWSEAFADEGVPSSDLGGNGDTYVNLLTGDIYTKAGDVWSIVAGAGASQIVQNQATPPNTAKPALSYPTGGGTLDQWDPDTQTWV